MIGGKISDQLRSNDFEMSYNTVELKFGGLSPFVLFLAQLAHLIQSRAILSVIVDVVEN